MPDRSSLRVAVMICSNQVNTQTNIRTAFDRLYYYLTQLN